MLIDLCGMKRIAVDPKARTARAGGGVLWGKFDAATQQHGLHTPGGRVTTTGLGGFTTGGGYGWTSSKYGLTCDNLLSAEVVLADGRVVTTSERENEDLFWGIRGGGGGFGISPSSNTASIHSDQSCWVAWPSGRSSARGRCSARDAITWMVLLTSSRRLAPCSGSAGTDYTISSRFSSHVTVRPSR
jgi:FAD/FMN-containing dehydrogenase